MSDPWAEIRVRYFPNRGRCVRCFMRHFTETKTKGRFKYLCQRVGLNGYFESDLRECWEFVRQRVGLRGYSECVRQAVGLHGYSECVRQEVGLRGYSESIVCVTMYFAVADIYYWTFKSIIRKGLSHADVTTLSDSPFFSMGLNKHNASLRWSI